VASPYEGIGRVASSKGSPYEGLSSSGGRKKKKGASFGGFLGNIGGGLRDLAVASGPGLVELGKFIASTPGTAGGSRRADENERFLRAVAQDFGQRYGPLARGDIGEFGHQLYEKPVPFALDATILASLGAGTGARGAAVAKAARTGGSVGKALRHGPPPELRYAKLPDAEAKALLGTYSRSALTRSTQKWLDGIRQKFPNAPIMGRSLYRKVGFQQVRLGQIEERLGRIGAEELLSVAGGRKLNAAQHRALRIQAEGVSVEERITKHRADLLTAKSAGQAKRLRGEIRLLLRAREYVDEAGKLTDPRLQAVYDLAKASTTRREDLLALVDELAPERAAARIQQPAQVFGGAKWEAAPVGGPSFNLIGKRVRTKDGVRGVITDIVGETVTIRPWSKKLPDRIEAALGDVFPAGKTKKGRLVPRTADDDWVRLSEIDDQLTRELRPVVDEFFPPAVRQREQGMRNILPHTRGKRAAAGLEREIEALGVEGGSGSVLANAYEQIEGKLLDLAVKPGANPGVVRLAALIKERDRLRATLNETAFTSAANKAIDVGTGEMFFTYSSKKRPTAFSRLGAARTIRHQAKPGTGQAFTGKAIEQGRIPRGEAILAAEAELEAWRFTTILRHRDRLEQFGKPLPTRGDDVALVLDELKGKTLPEEVRALLGKAGAGEVLAEEQLTVLARIGEGLRQQIFPGKWDDLQHVERFRAAVDAPVPGVLWIDKRLLGGIEAANPLVGVSGSGVGRGVLAGVDTINNASRLAILYLLPLKYITPNALSQVAFALIQQGFAAPVNLARAARLNAKLGRKAQLAIDAGMGEGFAVSIAGRGGGALGKLNNALGRWYGKIIDTPFRRASFLHEAHRSGFTTQAEINKLLFDPKLRDRRLATFMEANSEIIDYARLGRWEQNVIRRAIFFYPWMKGASVYGGRFLIEHPGKAWALDQLGKIGAEAQSRQLGENLPSYAEALAPIGSSGGLPTTLNLTSVSPFTTPYQMLRALTGDTRSAYSLGSQFSPALTAGIMATGFTPPGGFRSGPGAALRELYEGLPLYRYPKRMIEGPPERAVYPTTTWEDLFSLLLGPGVTPRRTNPQRLAEEARKGR